MSDYRWTVRLPDDTQMLELLHEVSQTSGVRLGSLLEEAVLDWYEALPVETEGEHDEP